MQPLTENGARSKLMNSKFRTSDYHPIQKIKVILAGLQVAVVTDFSVAYKVVLSVPVLAISFCLQKWVDLSIILLAMSLREPQTNKIPFRLAQW
jgi:diacylglycerol kinase (ATP)